MFVKLKILQQNIFGDICCTVFVSSIFVYLIDLLEKIKKKKRKKKQENMIFFSFRLSFLLILCFIHLKKKNCCM